MAYTKTDFDAVIDAPFGRVGIVLHGDSLADISFLSDVAKLIPPKTPFAKQVCTQLRAYFKNPRTRFSAKLLLPGTSFQQRVWQAMRKIPPGKVMSYGEMAKKLSTSARAVGNACRANPIPIIVPCHRVVSSSGDGGFMGKRDGHALTLKRWLLAHERQG